MQINISFDEVAKLLEQHVTAHVGPTAYQVTGIEFKTYNGKVEITLEPLPPPTHLTPSPDGLEVGRWRQGVPDYDKFEVIPKEPSHD